MSEKKERKSPNETPHIHEKGTGKTTVEMEAEQLKEGTNERGTGTNDTVRMQ
jgi:hypothetical protein